MDDSEKNKMSDEEKLGNEYMDKPEDNLLDEPHKEEPDKPDRESLISKEFQIKIDRTEYKISEKDLIDGKLTGAQLRKIPKEEIGPDRDLFEVIPGGSDRKIEATDYVEIRDGLRFFSAPAQINPG